MSRALIESTNHQGFVVSGELGFENVVELREQGNAFLDQAASQFEISLVGVTRAGSAAVSLLLSWLRYAAEREVKLVFSNLPTDLLGVAQISGIDQILPVTQD